MTLSGAETVQERPLLSRKSKARLSDCGVVHEVASDTYGSCVTCTRIFNLYISSGRVVLPCQVGDHHDVYSFTTQSLHTVSASLESCSCGLSVNIGIPCSHVFAVLVHIEDNLFRPELVANRLSVVTECSAPCRPQEK